MINVDRLQRIAEGNPDPDRIGAFGVGFYSLFSIAEEPIVSSGNELMGFFWKDDALFTRRAKSPSTDVSPSGKPWTTFHMALRERAPFPDSLLDLSRFMATSLTFTANVQQLNLFFDDHPLCRLNKRLEPAKAMNMPSHLNATSPKKMMRVQSLESTAMRLDVEAMRLVLDLLEKPKWTKTSLASAFTKTMGGGSGGGGGGGAFATMLQNAFGRSSSSKEKQQAPTPPAPVTPELSVLERTARSMTTVSSSVHVRIVTATAGVSVDRAFEREIERSTKKPPPKRTKVQVIAQNKDEADASSKEGDDDAKEIFKGITPSLDSQGFVFIGFKTSQTTSFAGHLAARFIPTVERESIDFIDRYCAQWNNELLAVGGYVTRAVYEAELYEVGKLWNEKVGPARPKEGDETAKWLLDRGLHVMRFFTFRASTPSPRVYSSLETAFFASARQQTLTLASTRGVKPSSLIRFPNAILSEFVKDLAVIPPTHVEGAQDFIGQVRARGLVGEITMDDVLSELSGRALEIDEMVACLKWWIAVSSHVNYDPSLRRRLLDSAIVQTHAKQPDDGSNSDQSEAFQPLASVNTFLNPQRVPTDVPLPTSCLSYEVSKAFSASDLARVFGWTELSLASWLSHIVELALSKDTAPDTNIELSPVFSEKVFGILARAWGSMPSHRHEEIAKIVKDVACIPTRKGMHKPGDSYFANVSLFEDLPIVAFPSVPVKANLERVLAALGVRRHVELQMIFDRLVAAGNWDVTQLVSYLAANKDTLTKLELERLTKTAMFPKAGEIGPPGKDGKPRILRYRASQLYEPIDALRAINLPVLDWPGKPWRSSSDEAKFAYELGLRRHPPLEELLGLASDKTTDIDLRGRALAYLLEKMPTVYKDSYNLKLASSFAFVPCEVAAAGSAKAEARWGKPTEVFTNAEANCLGFAIVSKTISLVDLPKLQLRANPTSTQILAKLIYEPTLDIDHAKKVFEYLSTVADISVSDYGRLKSTAFIPVAGKSTATTDDKKGESKKLSLAAPSECYFATKSASTAQMRDVLMDVFTFVDFGEKAAVFLRNCGMANEPSIEEVATKLVQTPQRFYSLGGVDAYLGILRQIANNWNRIRTPLRQEMKRSAFLLASKRISPATQSKGAPKNLMDDDDEEDTDDAGMLVHDLRKPSEVVVVDDATSHMLFASHIFAVPHEDLLEAFAGELGAPMLSKLVEERFVVAGRPVSNTKLATEIKALVLERTPLFLFEKRQTGKSEIRRDADWLKSHLEVMEVDGAGLRQTRVLQFGSVRATDEQRCSAMASIREGKLLLFIANNLDIDYFEVAMALSKQLLSRQRLQEVLLFMTLLSTSLRNLKRRGFHVDKILSQRKADKEAADRTMREERARIEREALEQPSDAQIKEWVQHMLAVFPDASPDYVERLLRSAKGDRVIEATNAMLETPYPKRPQQKPFADDASSSALSPSEKASTVAPPGSNLSSAGSIPGAGSIGGGGGLFANWRNRLKGNEGRSSLANGTSSIENIPGGWGGGSAITAAGRSASGAGRGGDPNAPPTQAIAQTRTPNPNADVTPASNIKRRVLSAVEASRGGPRNDDRIQSQGQQTQVKEAEQTYCDTTGVATDLRLAGQVGGMNVYVSPELDPAETLQNNDAALKRLIHQIILPIGTEVFDLDPRSLNVFADVKGPSIAFNRAGSLFLNLRYHLVWHDEQIKQGRLDEALISTYHSLAHELAHNLVAQHDSEHEFWFSSICEQYFTRFAALVSNSSSTSISSPSTIVST